MKNLIPLIGMAWIVISCSPDNAPDYDTDIADTVETTLEDNSPAPELAGRIYQEILNKHSGSIPESVSITQMHKEVQSLMGRYNLNTTTLTGESYQKRGAPDRTALDSLLAASPLSQPARESFTEFVYEIVDGTYATYAAWDAHIVTYQNEVTQQVSWPEDDKTMILTATCLIRQTGITLRNDREDEDWDIAIGNIYMLIAGVFEDTQTAIVNALIYSDN